MANFIQIPILLNDGKTIHMDIYEESPNTLFILDIQDALEYGESPYQLIEGRFYEFHLPESYTLEESEIVKRSKIESNKGRINTNIYVGSIEINILQNESDIGVVTLEIRSVKTSYRTDYRRMLEDITNKCTDLLLQQSSIIYQTFTIDANNDPQTLYQRFVFVDSIIKSELFFDSLSRINTMPAKKWESVEKHKNISNIRKTNRSVMRQIITNNNRTTLNINHQLKNHINSLPNKINILDKKESTDIPENRFIKYVLDTFLQFCLSIYQHPNAGHRLKRDALSSTELLAKYLSLPIFKDLSQLNMIPLNSPILQRKEGYREILQSYLTFDMAANLIWQGGENVYRGGKRDVAVLYEYWLFFKLLDLIEEVFNIEPSSVSDLIEITNKGLELNLKQGRLKMIEGVFCSGNRELHIEFYYNRTFSSSSTYPEGGSWTRNMRPDYTLSIWPENLSRLEAEEREMIVHIHFDAKYKIDSYLSLLKNVDLDEEKDEQARGNYKRADLLKMHAYKDAIRRTAGAYILYPGTEERVFQSYHEILPGLGAFAMSPTNTDNTVLKKFLLDIVQHFINRASQRELYSYRTFETFKEIPGPILKDILPMDYGFEHPKTTYVLIGYFKNKAHLEWILSNKLYNVRTDYSSGSLKLSQENTNAKYLLLHSKENTIPHSIYRLDTEGPRVISKDYMQRKKYPFPNIKPYYIGYSLESETPVGKEFGNVKWEIRKLNKYDSAKPFVVTLEELMQVKTKD